MLLGKIGNESSETVEQFKYLETTLTNQNSIHAEMQNEEEEIEEEGE
jgi:hypothetical protein